MRKLSLYVIMVMFFITVVSFGLAHSTEVMLNAKIDSATTQLDKNGTEYVRFLVTEKRNMNGVDYSITLPVMAFGENVKAAKVFKNGDDFKAIAQKRSYQGRDSYTIVQFIN